jgi:hypothetical protein
MMLPLSARPEPAKTAAVVERRLGDGLATPLVEAAGARMAAIKMLQCRILHRVNGWYGPTTLILLR